MKIGLLPVDGTKFPNFAIMKIAAYEKSMGNDVEFVNFFEKYDIVYKSKVFTHKPDCATIINAHEIIQGGTGYDYTKVLPDRIENIEPDYSLYPKFPHALGFLTRGCIRKCDFCIVSEKEGTTAPYRDIETILQNKKSAVLMDNNVLSHEFGLEQIENIIRIGCKVDFNQGLDARLIDLETAKMLVKVKWIDSTIRLACDSKPMVEIILKTIEIFNGLGYRSRRFLVYALITDDLIESYNRMNILKANDIMPFAQPFIDFTGKNKLKQWQKDMARWVNRKEYFNSCDFKDFEPRKGFKCSEYFKNYYL